MPDTPLLSQSAANGRAAPAAPAVEESQAPKVVEARTAILLLVTPEGDVVLTTDVNLPVTVERDATRDEAYGMLAVAMKDMTVQEAAVNAAQETISRTMAQAQRMQQAMQNKAVEEALRAKGGL